LSGKNHSIACLIFAIFAQFFGAVVMTKEKIIEVFNDFGRYLMDASKVVLGVAVLTPIFKDSSIETTKLVVGIVASLSIFISGSFIKGFKL
jgi:hypothetical protein